MVSFGFPDTFNDNHNLFYKVVSITTPALGIKIKMNSSTKKKKNVKLQIMSIKREMQLKRRVFCMVYNALDDSSNAIK